MLRNLYFIAILITLALASGWLAEHPGKIALEWFGYHIKTSAAFMLVALIAAVLLAWFGLKLLSLLLFMPSHIGKARNSAQQQKGLFALTEAFIALGDHDAQTAAKHIKLAEKYLPDPTLPRLLALQIARQQGDEATLKTQFHALQDSPQTRPLALRGMVEESRRDHRLADAPTQAHLQELLTLRPRHKPTLLLAIDVYSQQRRWQEALQWVSFGQKKWVFSRSEARHLSALIHTEQAQAMLAENNAHSATEMLKEALKREAGQSMAAILLAGIYLESGQHSQAASVIRTAWVAQSHPELAALYEQCFPTISAEKRLKKMQELVKRAPESWESLMAIGRAALNTKDYTLARQSLKAAMGQRETATNCKWMAELEQQENNDTTKANYWLGQAASAQADALWRCGNCGHQPQMWRAHCPECQQFDRISWQAAAPYAIYAA